jgi:hypothetical protein
MMEVSRHGMGHARPEYPAPPLVAVPVPNVTDRLVQTPPLW